MNMAGQLPALILQYSIVVFIIAMEVLIVVAILTKKIDVKLLISEKTGEASLSRFQFLLFTFAIVGLYVVIGFSTATPTFPSITEETLWLLGISGGTYAGSKAIQMNSSAEHQASGKDGPSGRFVR
ncbi:hypothetical protein [Roseibium sp.]|uniref:hypothetical protein n=1 Tax=Roseibium sp. TaxID=1936156 RepID=UPI003A96E263